MKVERIQTIPLDLKQAKSYAAQVAAEGMGKEAKTVKYLGGGSFGMAFLIQLEDCPNIVVKILKAKDMLEKETFDLKLLAENCPIPFPVVLFERKADDVIPVDCYAMSEIEGKNAFSKMKMLIASKRKRLDFADKVTSALHKIHCCQNYKFGDTLSPEFENWTLFYKTFAEAILKKAEELYQTDALPKKVIITMRKAWEKFDVIFSEDVKEACLIHGDLNVANIMVNKSYDVSGFIDPLNSMYADREYDLFQFDNLTGKRFRLRQTYIKKYGASRNCDIKCAFYGLWNEVYCYIKSGMLFNFIMNPLVKNMRKLLAKNLNGVK